MSLSAYLPLDEILTSSPSNSTMAEENKSKIKYTHLRNLMTRKVFLQYTMMPQWSWPLTYKKLSLQSFILLDISITNSQN